MSCTNCPAPVSKPMFTTLYTVIGIDSLNCRAVDSVQVNVLKPRFVAVPTAFTPNQDKINDKLTVRGKIGTKITVFRIYDRWGELLHDARDFIVNDDNYGWDGSFKGQMMNSGMYV
ncbi:MAG: T9SS type B sorting domain-containing protein, partial [Saprospiraceae bacterium]|nr:T9SS type B sorting domain-containing protein [Saprospiraceae bacterium]